MGGPVILLADTTSGIDDAPNRFAATPQARHGEIKESAQLRRRVPAAGIEQMYRHSSPSYAVSTRRNEPRPMSSAAW